MKFLSRFFASTLLFLAFFFVSALPAKALTNEDLAGVYQGTSTATLANGATISANLTITFKAKGNVKVVSTVNGQTSTSKGKYQFVSNDVILGSFTSSEFTAFVDVSGQSLTFTLLVKASDGSIISERTTASLVQKL